MPKTAAMLADPPGQEELEKIATSLGPFDPSAGFRFEPEFCGQPPRSIPPELYAGPYWCMQRRQIKFFFLLGLVILACNQVPIVKTWGLYVLPLQYLEWIGGGSLVISCIGWLGYMVNHGPLVYVEKGTPLAARILAISISPIGNMHGTPLGFRYIVNFQYRDPGTGKLVFSIDKYDVSTFAIDKSTLSYCVGDYVTVVFRQWKSSPPRLYGFLGLRSDLGFIDKPDCRPTVLRMIVWIGIGVAAFFLLGCFMYAYGKFEPIEFSFQNMGIPFLIGAVVFGAGVPLFFAWRARKAKEESGWTNQGRWTELAVRKLPESPKSGFIKTIFRILGRILLPAIFGGAIALALAHSLNALCDSSPAKPRPVQIHEMWMTTHEFVLREYTIEYYFPDDAAREHHNLMSTPWHMASFGQNRTGFAEVRKGFFGWPWVETITPR